MGAGCVHRSRSRHVAVLSPWWGTHLFLLPLRWELLLSQPALCSAPLGGAALVAAAARHSVVAACSQHPQPPQLDQLAAPALVLSSSACMRHQLPPRAASLLHHPWPLLLEVARTRRRPLGLVTRSTPASPMPLRQPPLARSPALMRTLLSLPERDLPSPLGSLPQPHDTVVVAAVARFAATRRPL